MESKTVLKSLGNAAKMCRKVVIVANTLAVIAAALLAVTGLLLRFGQNFIGPPITNFVLDLSKMANSDGLRIMDFSQYDFGKILAGTAFTLLLLSVGTSLVSGIGMFGAKQNLILCNIIYCIILALWILFEAFGTFIILVKRDLVDNLITPSLLRVIRQDYQGFNGTNTVSQTWNLIMISFSCCGVKDFKDFEDCEKWSRKYYQEGWLFELQTPLPCCVLSEKAVDDFSCAVNPKPRTSNYLKGCYFELWKIFDSYKMFIIILFSIIFLFQLMLLGCSAFLTWSIRNVRQKKEMEGKLKTRQTEYSKGEQPRNSDRRSHYDSCGGHRPLDSRVLRTYSTQFPGLPNHPYSAATLNMMQNPNRNYIGQLMAATLLQQQLEDFMGKPFGMCNQDHSAPPDFLRNVMDPSRCRGSQELALSVYMQRPYDTVVNPRLLALDRSDSSLWPLMKYNYRGIRDRSDDIARCCDCTNFGNMGYSSHTPEIHEISNDDREAVSSQRSRSNTMKSCRNEYRTARSSTSDANLLDTRAGHVTALRHKEIMSPGHISQPSAQQSPCERATLQHSKSWPTTQNGGKRRNSATQTNN